MHSKATVAGFVASGLLAAVALGACSNNSSAPRPRRRRRRRPPRRPHRPPRPPPAPRALITAAAESSSSVGSVSAVNGFGCSGSWAYADVTVGSGAASFDAVIVLEAQGSSWSVADRGNACNNHLVPSAIYTQACTTS